ncbi:MAG: phosphodiesterase [Clostridiales bacterium]|nr:phosphodiesterase [Clostridiales bacterium]
MKLLIASDIHGSEKYCRALIDEYNSRDYNALVLLGDILYHGPRNDLPEEYAPKEVFELLTPISDSILAIRGNCEAEVDDVVLPFPISAMYAVIYDGCVTMYLSHGHRELPKLKRGSVYLTGHTHIPKAEWDDERLYLNPGSVSIPKNGTPHSFMRYENRVFTWHDIVTGEEYMRQEIK